MEFHYSKPEPVVRPDVIMDRRHLVPRLRPSKSAQECATGFEDILGVLNGFKPVSVVPSNLLNNRNAAVLPATTAFCAGRSLLRAGVGSEKQGDWHSRLLTACTSAGLVYWHVTEYPEYVLVFHKDNISYAALLYVCLFTDRGHKLFSADVPGGVPGGQKTNKNNNKSSSSSSPSSSSSFFKYNNNNRHRGGGVEVLLQCIAGVLLGYEPLDIEALYLGEALSSFLLVDAYSIPAAKLKQMLPSSFLGSFHARFNKMLRWVRARGKLALTSKEVSEAGAHISRDLRAFV